MKFDEAALDIAIDRARTLPDDQCVRALLELRDEIRAARATGAERDPLDPSIARVSNTIAYVVDDAETFRVWEEHLRNASAVHGRTATPADWEELATTARRAATCAELTSVRAWNRVADTPIEGADRRTLIGISRALHAQYSFRERAGRMDQVRPLQERRLKVNQMISPPEDSEFLDCLTDLIQTTEYAGDIDASRAYRRRRWELRAEIEQRRRERLDHVRQTDQSITAEGERMLPDSNTAQTSLQIMKCVGWIAIWRTYEGHVVEEVCRSARYEFDLSVQAEADIEAGFNELCKRWTEEGERFGIPFLGVSPSPLLADPTLRLFRNLLFEVDGTTAGGEVADDERTPVLVPIMRGPVWRQEVWERDPSGDIDSSSAPAAVRWGGGQGRWTYAGGAG